MKIDRRFYHEGWNVTVFRSMLVWNYKLVPDMEIIKQQSVTLPKKDEYYWRCRGTEKGPFRTFASAQKSALPYLDSGEEYYHTRKENPVKRIPKEKSYTLKITLSGNEKLLLEELADNTGRTEKTALLIAIERLLSKYFEEYTEKQGDRFRRMDRHEYE